MLDVQSLIELRSPYCTCHILRLYLMPWMNFIIYINSSQLEYLLQYEQYGVLPKSI